MIVDGILLAQENRIISPNYSFGSKFVWKALKWGNNNIAFRRYIALDIFAVRGQRELKIISIFFLYIQSVQHRQWVFCPKYNSIYDIRTQIYAANLMRIHWISNENKAFFYTIEKPVRIVCWNICPPTCAYNHFGFTSIIACAPVQTIAQWNFFLYSSGITKRFPFNWRADPSLASKFLSLKW